MQLFLIRRQAHENVLEQRWKCITLTQHRTSYMCFSPAGTFTTCVCVCVCVFRGHLANKWLSEQSDELGVYGHTFNELRTRPEVKEREGGGRYGGGAVTTEKSLSLMSDRDSMSSITLRQIVKKNFFTRFLIVSKKSVITSN